MDNSQNQKRPISILIAAMGGEGGGVLMNWIVKAAVSEGYPVQATSIPGVAQRTGATTYYVEIWPEKLDSIGGKKPIFALSPAIGEVDIMIATELAEAARSLTNGYITANRTTLLASTHRVYLTLEKMAMGDGRLNKKKLLTSLRNNSKKALLFDASTIASEKGTIINAVLLGALSEIDISPLGIEPLKKAIEEEGKAVESNLAGFFAGLEAVKNISDYKGPDIDGIDISKSLEKVLETKLIEAFPQGAQEMIYHGITRLTDYQNQKYSELYLKKLNNFAKLDANLCSEVARHLAIRMSYEDIIRVAQAKIRRKRFERIKSELKTGSDDIYSITEFFKPGLQEVADILPSWLGKKLISLAKHYNILGNLDWGMQVQTTSIFGFLKIWFLAKLKWSRPFSMRWKIEHEEINKWLDLIKDAYDINVALAIEIAQLSRLIKGYGSTHSRGSQNYKRIVEILIEPIIRNQTASESDVKNIQIAIETALADPDGKALKKALNEGANKMTLIAAQ